MKGLILLILVVFGIFAMEAGYTYTGCAIFFIAVITFILALCED